jgi:hypothetical protein
MLNGFSDDRLVTTCHYNDRDGIHCCQGMLHKYIHPDQSMDFEGEKAGVISEPVKMEGFPLQCPACEGKGAILTERGRETMVFLQTFAYPMLRGMVQDIMEEKL